MPSGWFLVRRKGVVTAGALSYCYLTDRNRKNWGNLEEREKGRVRINASIDTELPFLTLKHVSHVHLFRLGSAGCGGGRSDDGSIGIPTVTGPSGSISWSYSAHDKQQRNAVDMSSQMNIRTR